MSALPARVAITGAAGFIGRRLTAALASRAAAEVLVLVDRASIPAASLASAPERVIAVYRDIREPLHDVLMANRIECVIHLAHLLRPYRNRARARAINVGGTRTLLHACARAGVTRVLYMSSATVYGAWPSFTRPYVEDDPPRPVPGFQYSEDKVEAERHVLDWGDESPGRAAVVLRGCVVVGRGARNFVSDTLGMRLIPTPAGADPEMQLLHQDDLADAVLALLEAGCRGIFNVAGGGTMRWSKMARVRGGRIVPVPAALLRAATALSWSLRLQSASPACGIELIRHPWLVSTEKLRRATGWAPRHSSEAALRDSIGAEENGSGGA